MNRSLERFRFGVARSSRPLGLGVFRGLAEHLGFSVFWTRVVGSIALLSIVGTISSESTGTLAGLLAAGFFYVLIALLMDPPRAAGQGPLAPPPPLPRSEIPRAGRESTVRPPRDASPGQAPSPWQTSTRRPDFAADWERGGPGPAAGAFRGVSPGTNPSPGEGWPRADLAALNRQLERLNRRIARIENIVTAPGYDWERRLED